MSFITREYKFENNVKMQKKDQHTTAMRSLRNLVKPLLRLIRKKQLLKKTLAEFQEQNAYNSSLEDMRKDAAAQVANNDNLANEELEQRLYNELDHAGDNAAIIVQQGNQQHLMPVHSQSQEKFIPVHFARTANGTFFWTSMDVSRQQELQLRLQFDRWGQA